MTIDADSAAPSTLAFLDAIWGGRPEAIRVYSPSLELVWANELARQPEYLQLYAERGPLKGEPADPARSRRCPTHEVARGAESALGVCNAPPTITEGRFGRLRVRSWAWQDPQTGARLIAEEIQPIAPTPDEEDLEWLNLELENLVEHAVSYIEDGSGGIPRLKVLNPNIRPCGEMRSCDRADCPVRSAAGDAACYEVPAITGLAAGATRNPIAKTVFCSRCEVFQLACANPFNHLAENVNRLAGMLQAKVGEVVRAQQRIEQADKVSALGELMSGIAHEFKNAIGIIMGRVEVLTLELEDSNSDLAADLAVILEQSSRLKRTVDHLLKMARPGQPVFEEIRLDDVVRATLSVAANTLKKSQVEARYEPDGSIPPVRGDASQLQQVLLNLLLNARDAMQGGGVIEIALGASKGREAAARISVRDRGCGMGPEELDRIFMPFYTTKRDAGGAGMGLPVCRRIMGEHGGRIEAHSKKGEGTTMVMVIPIGGPGG